MDYSEARAAFFAPRPDAGPCTRWQSPARRLRDALEPLATVSFWAEPAYDAYAALGLDFLTGYVWSRSSVLGLAEPTVVAATFGVFEPAAVAGLLTAARECCSLEQIRAARELGAVNALREVLPDGGDLTATTDVLRDAAVRNDVTGRPLYAGALGQPNPRDPHAALWHVATVLRECRGDGHLAACVAAGLTGLEANLLTELWVGYPPQAYAGSRAWSADAMADAQSALRSRGLLDADQLSAAGIALRERVEHATDDAMDPVVQSLGGHLDAVVDRCTQWSTAVIDRGWFPPDPYKRAAG